MREDRSRLVDRLPHDEAARLHRDSVTSPADIRAFFELLVSKAVPLDNGISRRNALRRARVVSVGADSAVVDTTNVTLTPGRQLHFNCSLDGTRYFFSLTPESRVTKGTFSALLPSAIYRAERRDLERAAPLPKIRPFRVELRDHHGTVLRGSVIDWSDQGLGVRVKQRLENSVGKLLEVRFLNGDRAGRRAFAILKNCDKADTSGVWTRLGLEISDVPIGGRLSVERRPALVSDLGVQARIVDLDRRKRAEVQPEVEVVRYPNNLGNEIAAIINTTGETVGAPAVVISPPWGRTKETLVALAHTLISTFEAEGEPLVVLRLDGTERRGESYISPECRKPGDEYLRFTFSQAAKDLQATFKFLKDSPRFQSRSIILVTFSAGAIDGRRAIATDPTALVRGWVSVVGMVDVQSGLRAVSGGVDYALGVAKGVTFGMHELLGVMIDIDRTGRNGLEDRLLFLEDARRDMAKVRIPVTWIHGEYDAWIDPNRVKALLSAGDVSRRRLIELPIGHQMRVSNEAISAFELVASEVGRMALTREVKPKAPQRLATRSIERAERARRPRLRVNLRDFWRKYLLGRDSRLGIDLMTATSAYRELMKTQIELLDAGSDQLVLDLGSGTGIFPLELTVSWPSGLQVIEIDWVTEALTRARRRIALKRGDVAESVRFIGADMSNRSKVRIPIRDEAADGVLGSLMVSYIDDPESMVGEIKRCLKPGGRLVLSSLRQDADISRIYVDGVRELQPARVREEFGEEFVAGFEDLHRTFLNDASHILDIEEAGEFRFFDGHELSGLLQRGGFESVRVVNAFGIPPQAVIVAARKPR